jgi:membrane protein
VLADYVGDALTVVQQDSSVSGPAGLAIMIFAALAAFVQLDWAFDRIWKVPTTGSSGLLHAMLEFLIQRGRAFLLLLGVGGVVVVVFLSGMVLAGLESHTHEFVLLSGWVWSTAQIALTIGINAAVFTLINRLLPKANVSWGDALRGGLLTAAGWEIGRQILAEFVVRAEYTSAYGVIGAFLGILLWCYYAVAIVLLGAEHVRIIHDRRIEAMRHSGSS